VVVRSVPVLDCALSFLLDSTVFWGSRYMLFIVCRSRFMLFSAEDTRATPSGPSARFAEERLISLGEARCCLADWTCSENFYLVRGIEIDRFPIVSERSCEPLSPSVSKVPSTFLSDARLESS